MGQAHFRNQAHQLGVLLRTSAFLDAGILVV